MNISAFQKNIAHLYDFIYFDENDYLREKTTAPLKLQQYIADAKDLLRENDEHQFYLCGMIGNLYRICEQPTEALNYLEQCLQMALEEGNIKREIASLIRLGEAFKYAGQPQKAFTLFNLADEKCQIHHVTSYVDFTLQHKGKCLMELGELGAAEECLKQSLQLRKQKDDPSLIKSTELALNLIAVLKKNV